MLTTARSLKDIAMVRTLLRKSGLDAKLMEFLPANKRTDENFKNLFKDKGLGEIVNIQKLLVCITFMLNFYLFNNLFPTFYASHP